MYKNIYWTLSGGGNGEDWYDVYFDPKDGRGIFFGINGCKYRFSWVNPEKDYKCDFSTLPKNIRYSLLHYGNIPYIKVPKKLKIDHTNLIELINADKSFKIVNKKHVKAYKILEKTVLTSLEDVLNYEKEIKLLKNIGIPTSFTNQIFKLNSIKETKAVNGEIGIASFINGCKLSIILDNIFNKNEE